ncbi:MAG: hypothetical protein C0501_17835 [Isosphaera sp.]|nr:hypothetical protein [Isosphaera sp.]
MRKQLRLGTRYSVLIPLGLVGCSPPAADGPAPAAPNVVLAAPAPTPDPPAVPVAARPDPAPPPKPADPPPFEYPADLGGRAVARVVAPGLPPLPPAERFGAAPRLRTPPARLLDPDPVSKVRYVPPPLTVPTAVAVRPAAPRERVPADLGAGAADVPARPTFPVAAGVTERARDVNLPPPLPTLGRPPADRVPFDDPTAEAAHAAVTGPAVRVPPPRAGFLRVAVPDPFELGGQVRPRVPPAAEPGLVPVVVDPRRVK